MCTGIGFFKLIVRSSSPYMLLMRAGVNPSLGCDSHRSTSAYCSGDLNAHAAVAERALVLREKMLVGRVVLIDQERVGEIEPNPPERIAVSRGLIDPDRAVPVMADP